MDRLTPANRLHHHFTGITPIYNQIRTTDPEPVFFIKQKLGVCDKLNMADIGCGSGRYDLLLLQNIPGLHLVCCDINEAMLNKASQYLTTHGQLNFSIQLTDAHRFCIHEGKLTSIVTFNAIHHLDPLKFLNHAARQLSPGGYIFIYTRLAHHNRTSIWGQYFPHFLSHEKRLYDLGQIKSWLDTVHSLTLDSIQEFTYQRTESLYRLVEQAKNRHYSTFSFYKDQVFYSSLEKFIINISAHFTDLNRIQWYDKNIMIVFQKKSRN